MPHLKKHNPIVTLENVKKRIENLQPVVRLERINVEAMKPKSLVHPEGKADEFVESKLEISQSKAESETSNINTQEDSLLQQESTVLIKLRTAFKNENGLIQYNCQVCQENHYSEESFTRHWYLHTIYDPRVTCVICHQKFRKLRKFKNHLSQKHASHPYKCSTCFLVFEGSYEDDRHTLCHVQKCNYFCKICGIGCETFAVLEFHTFSVHVEGCRSAYTVDQDSLDLLFIKMESTE